MLLIALAAHAASPSLNETRRALHQAEAIAAGHRQAATAAQRNAAAAAAKAAALAAQQVQAAAALRHLEDQTAAAAARLADLQAQSAAATAALQADAAALSSLLPVMQRLAVSPASTLLAAPTAPVDTVRGLMILQGLTTEIARRAAAIQTASKTLAVLTAATTAQQTTLTQAAAVQQTAEAALNGQIAAARQDELALTDMATRQQADALTASQTAATLTGVIDRLQAAAARAAALARTAAARPPPRMTAGAAPVAGRIIQHFGAPTVAGPAVGLIYQAAPGAAVTAPCGGPVLFANHFQGYGLLVILDCGGNYDFVLAGMSRLAVTAGQMLTRGQPLGQMAAYQAKAPATLPHLYVELRQNGAPVDPARWLAGRTSG